MVTLNTIDLILYEAQRQGRISFYLTNYGEEAFISCGATLDLSDVIFGQYRTVKLAYFFTVALRAMNSWTSATITRKITAKDDRCLSELSDNIFTRYLTLVGAAYALKRVGKKNCAMCFFGDGAASEGDFHAALNFAATMQCPVIFWYVLMIFSLSE